MENLPRTTIETWFIPFDIIRIISTILPIFISFLFLLIILLDKTCHTIPMMLIANTYLSVLLLRCTLLSMSTFALENDLQQIQYQDSLCVFRSYLSYTSTALFHYSIMLQALYRYIVVVYPTRLFLQSAKFQLLTILFKWIFCFIYPIPFLFTKDIIYDPDNQVCELPLQLSFPCFYIEFCLYIIPMSGIILIHFKLVRYVHRMRQHITPVNTLFRAQRELKMVRRIAILVGILLTVGLPYTSFFIMSFFTRPPKYHFRIIYMFFNVSVPLVMIALFQFADTLKESLLKRIKRRSNRIIVQTIT